jgi:hypothetical protein
MAALLELTGCSTQRSLVGPFGGEVPQDPRLEVIRAKLAFQESEVQVFVVHMEMEA